MLVKEDQQERLQILRLCTQSLWDEYTAPRQHNEAWIKLEQRKQGFCIRDHFASAQRDVQKKSLCDIAALLY